MLVGIIVIWSYFYHVNVKKKKKKKKCVYILYIYRYTHHTYIYIYIHHTHTHTYIYITHTHTHTHIYIYIYIYIYIQCFWKVCEPFTIFQCFLHKYDPKHNQILFFLFEREPNQTNETKIFSFSFIYSGKWSNIAYLWVAKVCEPLGLAVNLKVKLESIVQRCFQSVKCQYVTCFIKKKPGIYQSLIMFVEVNHVMNKGDYWGPRK